MIASDEEAQASVQAWREQGTWFQFRDQRVFYRDEGAGPVLLCLHGFPTSSWDWHALWPQLVQGHRVIAPDFLGFGFSSKPQQLTYDIATQTDVVCSLLDALRVDRAHLLVHDYGTIVAQELLARVQRGQSPLTVTSVCSLNASVFPDLARPRFIQRVLASRFGPSLRGLIRAHVVKRGLRAVFGTKQPPSSALLSAMWSIMREQDGQRLLPVLLGYLAERKAHATRWNEAWTRAELPRRLVVGAEDPVAGMHVLRPYRERVTEPDVVLLEGVGHYAMLEDPGATMAAIESFLQHPTVLAQSHRVGSPW